MECAARWECRAAHRVPLSAAEGLRTPGGFGVLQIQNGEQEWWSAWLWEGCLWFAWLWGRGFQCTRGLEVEEKTLPVPG